jgi:hypothetical protein
MDDPHTRTVSIELGVEASAAARLHSSDDSDGQGQKE